MVTAHSALATDFEELMSGAPVSVGELFERCRSGPPFWSDRVGGWVVTRHAGVSRILKDEITLPPLK